MAGYTIREAGAQDAEAVWQLGNEAFNGLPEPPPAYPDPVPPGCSVLVTCDATGAIVGKCRDRQFDSWWNGRVVPIAGVAGVVVDPEHRGAGLMRPMIRDLLRRARERGAIMSTLFPSAPGIYRGLGYETVCAWDVVELPTADLAEVRTDPAVTLRRARLEDVPTIRALYATWASRFDGPLVRAGANFPASDGELLSSCTGITLAEDATGVQGYAGWQRRGSYSSDGHLELEELVALTPGALRGLVASLGSNHSVARTIRRVVNGPDPIAALLPQSRGITIRQSPYMLALLDVPAALQTLAARRVAVDLTFTVTGHPLDDDTAYRLVVRDGEATCETLSTVEPGASDAYPLVTAAGLAGLATGALPVADARDRGLLTGPDNDDWCWAAVFGGRPIRVFDGF